MTYREIDFENNAIIESIPLMNFGYPDTIYINLQFYDMCF